MVDLLKFGEVSSDGEAFSTSYVCFGAGEEIDIKTPEAAPAAAAPAAAAIAAAPFFIKSSSAIDFALRRCGLARFGLTNVACSFEDDDCEIGGENGEGGVAHFFPGEKRS